MQIWPEHWWKTEEETTTRKKEKQKLITAMMWHSLTLILSMHGHSIRLALLVSTFQKLNKKPNNASYRWQAALVRKGVRQREIEKERDYVCVTDVYRMSI